MSHLCAFSCRECRDYVLFGVEFWQKFLEILGILAEILRKIGLWSLCFPPKKRENVGIFFPSWGPPCMGMTYVCEKKIMVYFAF